MTLLLLSYNNYFNRVIKRDTLEGYLTHKSKYVENYAFQYRDGVNTDITITWKEDFTPDYCVVLKEDDTIDSRWFLTDAKYINGSQFFSTLKRDLVADYYEDVINAPAFIEKGYITDDNPLIYNKEDFNCNQIKIKEKVLYDATKCSWLVFYYDTKSSEKAKLKTGNTSDTKIVIPEENFIDLSGTVSSLENWRIWQLYHNGYTIPISKNLRCYFRANNTSLREGEYITYYNNLNWDYSPTRAGYCREGGSLHDSLLDWQSYTNPFQSREEDTRRACVGGAYVWNTVLSHTANIGTLLAQAYEPEDELNVLLNKYNNQIVKFGDGKFYKVSFHHLEISTEPIKELEPVNPANTSTLYANIASAFDDYGWGVVTEDSTDIGLFEHEGAASSVLRNTIYLEVQYDRYQVLFQEYETGNQYFQVDMTGCQDIADQPYGVACIPYMRADKNIFYFDAWKQMPDGLPLATLQWLLTRSGAKIYDAQILPYCPFEIYDLNGTLDTSRLSSIEKTYIYYDDEPTYPAGFILHPRSSKFTKNITVDEGIIDEDIKVNNQCTFYRLVSPNYSGQFEFSLAKNGGSINYVNIDCTYKPYAPYIHVNPDFKGLYGQDFDDARGLICGGDFSTTIMNDAWNDYKMQNKNFQDIFNRQIENMDTQHSINQDKQIANWFTSAGKGAIGGAIAGNAGGAILGGGGGLLSGGINYYAEKKSYEENRDYTIDMHNYQLDNIKALPQSLAKVDAYNNNNKLFPFLEKYSCTEEEKEIFREKLRYEGMTINARGTIARYLNPSDETFIKAQITRLPNLEDDSHIAYAIYEELNKGVYL